MRKFNVFIDGSCLDIRNKEKARGGWGYIITDENFSEIKSDFGKIRKGTQNSIRAELEALCQALKKIKTFKGNCKFNIYCDYKCIYDSLEGFCERKANRDYWDEIELLCEQLRGKFRIFHIKGHQYSNDDIKFACNNKVDKLAKSGANSLTKVPVKAM